MRISKELAVGLTAQLIVGALLVYSKPSLMFDSQGDYKAFGPQPGQTLLPFWMAVLLVGILAYVLM